MFLGKELEREYYFDIMRTKHEAYSHIWQQLHQVQSSEETEEQEEEEEEEGEGEGGDPAYATVTM